MAIEVVTVVDVKWHAVVRQNWKVAGCLGLGWAEGGGGDIYSVGVMLLVENLRGYFRGDDGLDPGILQGKGPRCRQ